MFPNSNGMIAYIALPRSTSLRYDTWLFNQLQGVLTWEIESDQGAYFSLERWMTKTMVQSLHQALRRQYGPRIRFGAAVQKTTARAAALYRPVPHATIVTPENTEQFLSQLPIHLLPGLGRRTTRYLEQRGVTTFAAFRDISSTTMKQWFGVSGLILQQFAQGIDPRTVEPRRRTSFA